MGQKITQRTLDRLPVPTEKDQIIWDAEVRGLGVRITPGGVVTFVLAYRNINGRQRRFSIGRYPELSLGEARNEANELRAYIRKGGDPVADKQRARGEMTVSQLCDRYLDEYAKVRKRKSSLRDDISMIGDPEDKQASGRQRRKDGIIRPRLGRLTVSGIEQRDIMNLHNSLKKTPYRANRVLSLLSKMFSLAMKWGMRADNPAKGVPRFHEEKREAWLTTEQMAAFRAALDSYKDQNAANALRLLLLTGSRAGEVLKSEWAQFDLERGTWTKPSHSTKQKRVEHVPLSPPAIQLLSAMRPKHASGPLFPGRGGKKARVSIRRPWVQACKAAGLVNVTEMKGKRRAKVMIYTPTVRMHDLRHSFASHLVSGGVSLQIVGRLLGHTLPSTTQRYAHLSDKALQDATNRFADIFAGAEQKPVQ